MSKIIQTAISHLKKQGYGIITDFLSPSQCEAAVNQINRLIEKQSPQPLKKLIFTSADSRKIFNQDQFLSSSDKVSYFFEEKAFQNGKLVVPKLHSINKIGHALHQKNDIFKQITYRKQIGQICLECNIPHPVVVQSMAILKPPFIGGKVSIHQDSTFLFDEPQTLIGFWIPLQDATVQNGCLWGLPGSHQGKLYKRSRMDWNNKEEFVQIMHENDYNEQDFVPLEMKRGSLAFFYGRFLHKSHPNLSDKSRYAYTWHLKQKGTSWAHDNWLQRQKFPDFQFSWKK